MFIEFIEANMTGLQHSFPNSNYLHLFSKLCERMSLNCSVEHYDNLNIEDLEIEFNPVKVLKPGKHRIKKFFLEYFQSRRIIKKSTADLIVFLSCFPNVQFFLMLFSKKIRNKKIIFITHGEAEGLELPGKWKVWSYPFWITLCFKLKTPPNVYRIVLGESIVNNISKHSLNPQTFFIDQPIERFKDNNSVIPIPNNNIFSYIGNCLYKKGGKTILDASKYISEQSNSYVEIIGAYDLDEELLTEKVHLLGEPHKMIPRDKFDEALEKITYACFPYPSNTYKFTASAALLDAIIYLKPIIYIRNDYFDGVLNNAGDVGYRCENEQEFCETVMRLDNEENIERYKKQINNLKKLQSKFSFSHIETQLKEIIYSILGE